MEAQSSVSPDTGTTYALDLLSDARYHIEGAIHELPAARRRVERHLASDQEQARDYYAQLEKEQQRLLAALDNARLALLEIEDDASAQYTASLHAAVTGFNLMTQDYTKLCGALDQYLQALPASSSTVNASIIGRLMNNVRMGYYPTDLVHIEKIAQGIQFPENARANLLDPCCGCGLALCRLADGNNCFTYGVELDESRVEEAQERLHRVGVGSFFHSRVSAEAFHAMLLNPPYLSILGPEGKRLRHEKKFLVESYEHIMIGGLLIYIIPFYRLTTDIARILCDNFADLTVWRFLDDEFKRFKQVAILGTRQKRVDGSEVVPDLLDKVAWAQAMPSIAELPAGRYILPDTQKKVELFKGEVFNILELAEQLKTSNSLKHLHKKSLLENRERRPLLPLSIGQVGLIGGSGLINGLIDCDTPHVIKGRIIKQSRSWSTDLENAHGQQIGTETHTTISNKMIFNVLTEDGIKTLT